MSTPQILLQTASTIDTASSSGSPNPAPLTKPDPSARATPSFSDFSTDMRVDKQHQVYYEIVDKSTGDVMFEIPPEALREIGESLDIPLDGNTVGHSLDIKS